MAKRLELERERRNEEVWRRNSIEENRCWDVSNERAFIKSRGAQGVRRATRFTVLAGESVTQVLSGRNGAY
jgi:hypothetical protein